MAKFLNKKQRVIDLKLTSYGNYLFSIGTFKPEYYAFFDDNIIYDSGYVHLTESQNSIHERIKEDTAYIESLVLFEDVENESTLIYTDGEIPTELSDVGALHAGAYFDADVTAVERSPRLDNYKFNSAIGDAKMEGNTQNAPAWKLVTLNGNIVSSSAEDSKNEVKIPQLNIDLNYAMRIRELNYGEQVMNEDFRRTLSTTPTFGDGKVIELVSDDALIYVDEQNTQLLTENFDIEVFEIEFDALPGSYDAKASAKIVCNSTTITDYQGTSFAITASQTTTGVEKIIKFVGDASSDGASRVTTLEEYKFGAKTAVPTNVQAKRVLNALQLAVDNNFGIDIYKDDASNAITIIRTDTGEEGNTPISSDFDSGTLTIDGFTGGGTVSIDKLDRKYFPTDTERIKGGFLPANADRSSGAGVYGTMAGMNLAAADYEGTIEYGSGSVAYYFDILTDSQISQELACRGAAIYNKKSYYIDLDYDCQAGTSADIEYVDIYGVATEPEICL